MLKKCRIDDKSVWSRLVRYIDRAPSLTYLDIREQRSARKVRIEISYAPEDASALGEIRIIYWGTEAREENVFTPMRTERQRSRNPLSIIHDEQEKRQFKR